MGEKCSPLIRDQHCGVGEAQMYVLGIDLKVCSWKKTWRPGGEVLEEYVEKKIKD